MTEPDADTLQDELASRRSPLMPFRSNLFIVMEGDRPGSGGARYALTDVDEVVVGRGRQRMAKRETMGGVRRLLLEVPGRSMSSMHARFLRSGEVWEIEDARSTNGSFVNGKRVERAVLEEGDAIELGHTIFALRVAMPTPPGTLSSFDSVAMPAQARGLETLVPSLFVEFEKLGRLSSSDLSVLLLGETGTGKEVVARAVHQLSGRSGAFIAVNCGALAANLVESQLFGHVRGAFSGADRDAPGYFRAADQGTLLLDEIGDLPLAAQAALLRVMQEREVTPVGSPRPVRVDVRVLAATHRSLDALVERGQFRADLLARLDGYRCLLPALKDRREDLGIMAGDILSASGTVDVRFAPDAGLDLVSYDWPFNVRELVQVLKRSLVFAERGVITRQNLGLEAALAARAKDLEASTSSRPLTPEDVTLKESLHQHLRQTGGNVTEVARLMGKARMQIQRWMKRYGIDPEQFRS